MTLAPKLKRNIVRILPFGIIWLIFGLIFIVVEYAATSSYDTIPEGVIEIDRKVFIFAMIAVTMVGIMIGIIELVFINHYFKKKSFATKLFGKLLIYSSFLFLIICVTFPIAASIELEVSVFDPTIREKFFNYLNSITFLSTGFQMAVSLGATLFYAEISENIGHGILINFFSGKYHTPKEEIRIFMFLDMKSSTAIAEKLGHVQYFNLLKEYYHHLSDAIVAFSGEIYQYVGDEMVISWNYDIGLKNNNCINCFFTMKEALKAKHDWYQQKFQVTPSFKAGLHFGAVTTGEIGSLKKEIIFTGDVLNATARIQALCNTYNVDLLVSADLMQRLNLPDHYAIKSLGDKELRGKQETLELYTISKV